MLNELVENDEYSYLTEKLDWYFLPVTNPDGYVYTWENKENENRYWRANRIERNGCVSI